ncbi:MAG: hypothetical protein H6704_10435 [Myxococcales bacterium]|nr:hypothetical protein [Myxococcales bacterium]
MGGVAAIALAAAGAAWPAPGVWVVLGGVGLTCAALLGRPDARRFLQARDRRGVPRLTADLSGWR